MKNYQSMMNTFAALVASALMLFTQSAAAQGAGGGGGRGGRGAMANFTDEQRQALRDMNQDLRDVEMKVNEARTALNDAVYAEQVDENAIKKAAATLAQAEQEEALARAKAFAKIRSKFTSEEIDVLKRFGGRGGRRFGGGRRGGGGGGGGGN